MIWNAGARIAAPPTLFMRKIIVAKSGMISAMAAVCYNGYRGQDRSGSIASIWLLWPYVWLAVNSRDYGLPLMVSARR
jgi:hypothetical protein